MPLGACGISLADARNNGRHIVHLPSLDARELIHERNLAGLFQRLAIGRPEVLILCEREGAVHQRIGQALSERGGGRRES